MGNTTVDFKDASGILTKATGFMSAYDYTLNPYAGCGFGCSYCYAASFAGSDALREDWGQWVSVKRNALDRLRRRRKSLAGRSIYMSSVTDPYQPVERRLGLVRSLLDELLLDQPVLVVQTRSPLVLRDVDLLKRFERARVCMTVTTDSERVRRAFEPQCTPIERRLETVGALVAAGIDTAVTMTPLLPLEDATAFAKHLRSTGAGRFVVQPFHVDRGNYVAGTRPGAIAIARELHWDAAAYRKAVHVLRTELPELLEGRAGFSPP
jgi:DNA repair photolyase